MPARHRTAATYGYTHKKTRAKLLPAALGTPCPGDHYPDGTPYRSPNCVGTLTHPSHMHLAHTTPAALGGEHGDYINCAPCNLGAGAILGNRLRQPRPPRRTRDW